MKITCSGTSMAAAHVSGVAALLIEKYDRMENQITPGSLKELLINTTYRIKDTTYWNPRWGYGLVDVENALSKLPYVDIGFPSSTPGTAWNPDDIFIRDMGSSKELCVEIENLETADLDLFVEGVKVRFGVYNISLGAGIRYYELGVVECDVPLSRFWT